MLTNWLYIQFSHQAINRSKVRYNNRKNNGIFDLVLAQAIL